METLADVNVVALDKTGTLTSGELTLASLECLHGEEKRLKQIASTLARLSQHPLSRAIRKMAHQWDVEMIRDVTKFRNNPRSGAARPYRGENLRCGKSPLAWAEKPPDRQVTSGSAEVWVAGPDLLGRMIP